MDTNVLSESCDNALGMESRKITDKQITVSSSFDHQSVGPTSSRYFLLLFYSQFAAIILFWKNSR